MIFSVVVPFLNEEQYLEQTIESLLKQSFDDRQYELIFIDNGSTDQSAEIVGKHQNITLLQEPKKDPYLARNRGIRATRGEYIAFTDADCIADPRWLSELWNELKTSNADIVLGRLLYPDPTPLMLKCYEEYYDAKIDFLLVQEMRQCYYGHCGNMVVRASVFQEIGLFSGMPVVGDTEVIHWLMKRNPNMKISYANAAHVVHSEVDSFRRCLYKLYECGQYSATYQQQSSYRPLQLKEKIEVFKRCIRDRKYGALRTFVSGAALLTGWASFESGRFAQWLSNGQSL